MSAPDAAGLISTESVKFSKLPLFLGLIDDICVPLSRYGGGGG
jgi:hypothetical protein